jgi:hypothetical protein
MTYEKEILALKTPLTQEEVEGIVMGYADGGIFYRDYGVKYESKLRENGKDIYVYYVSDLDLPTHDTDEAGELSHKGLIEYKKKDYYGSIQLNYLAAGEKMPVSLRIISFKEDCNLWWMNIAQDIIRESKVKLPNFSHDIEISFPSKEDRDSDNSSITNTPSLYVPQDEKSKIEWKKAYAIILKTRKIFKKDWEELDRDSPTPKIGDYIDAISREMGKKRSERTIRRIITAGEAGLLK